MSHIYVHLSDIHFGQEKGGDIYVHDDIKEQLLLDVQQLIASLPQMKANGIIISGDIAYAGKSQQYEEAGRWLDRLTSAAGCDITAVQLVPGNHDIDRDQVTPITQTIIDQIIEKGDDELDKYLESEQDREFIYKQFEGYRKFAEGYDCPLDAEGRVKTAKIVEIAAGKTLRFLGVNTALICSKSPKEYGGLLLGKRQRIIPKQSDLETIVIAHHPLNWLQDSADAKLYIQNRARIFISGHEHKPSHRIEKMDDGGDLLILASGAAVPPGNEKGFMYCYNILEFGWDDKSDTLKVGINARMWDDQKKAFAQDNSHYENGQAIYHLRCPNFSIAPAIKDVVEQNVGPIENEPKDKQIELCKTLNENHNVEDKEYHLTLLKFFRDLSSAQRLGILIELGAIPSEWTGTLTHTLERKAFDKLIDEGALSQIHDKINQNLQQK